MVTPHCKKKIEERNISVDIETIEMLTDKSQGVDTAYILGEIIFLDEPHYVILIVRHGDAITIEPRRKTQNITKQLLKVDSIESYPCIF